MARGIFVVKVLVLIALLLGLVLLPGAGAFRTPFKSTFKKLLTRHTLAMSQAGSFVKYQGLGNDFILIDNTHAADPLYSAEQAVKMCDRNFGIGADGVIFALPGSNGCDYTMRIYNSDGSEPQMCGNGIRCMAKFLQHLEKRDTSVATNFDIWTNAGIIKSHITAEGGVIVDMGTPILHGPTVPTKLPVDSEGRAIEAEIVALDKTYHATAVSMGNPHCIIFVDDLATMDPPFSTIGPVMERHPAFPQRVNAEFVQVHNRGHVQVKVWERGAGPTLACGTGACAVVVAGVLTGRLDRQCKVSLPGGDLHIRWDETDNKLYMTGPAEAVFQGSLLP